MNVSVRFASALFFLLLGGASCAIGQYTGLTSVTIGDPDFNGMAAEAIAIPSGWKLEGTMMISPCTTLPWQVFRAYSRDGLTEMRDLPTFGWKWSSHPQYANFHGCMQYSGPITAAQFLTRLVETMPGGVHVVGPAPVAPAFQQWAQQFAAHLNNTAQSITYAPARADNTADTAALRIETHNGTFVVEQRLRAAVECSIYRNPGPLQGGTCFARVEVLRAPEGKLDALIRFVDSHDMIIATPTSQYVQAISERERQRGVTSLNDMKAMQGAAAATLDRMNAQFTTAMQQNHQAFMNQQESQYRSFQAGQAAQHQVRDNYASDMVDYALDRQTVSGQGGTAHIDANYAHTWSSTVGNQTQWFQTNDVNANPNGALSGNWTEDTRVHGNGQPY